MDTTLTLLWADGTSTALPVLTDRGVRNEVRAIVAQSATPRLAAEHANRLGLLTRVGTRWTPEAVRDLAKPTKERTG